MSLRLSRKRGSLALAFAALLLMAIGVLSLRRSHTPGSKPELRGDTRAVSSAGGSGAGAGTDAQAGRGRRREKDEVPLPGCWPALRDFDRSATLEDLRAAIAAAAGRDPLLATYLQERLTEMIGGDLHRALTVLAWASQASGPELEVLLAALKAAPAVQERSVVEGLLAMGENETASIELRSRALDALETQERLDAATIRRMKAIALDDRTDAAAWMAARTLGRVMTEDFRRTGTYEPYWSQLLAIGRESEETAVQLLALEMLSYADPVLDGGSIDGLAELLRGDPDRNVREMAAHRLSVTSAPDRVLAIYRAAFPLERDECVRWAIFRFSARVAGAGSLPLLADFAALDPRFVQDRDDFAALYNSGTVDFARIWLGKAERHQCVAEEGA